MAARISASFEVRGVGDVTLPVTFQNTPVFLSGVGDVASVAFTIANPLNRDVYYSVATVELSGPAASKLSAELSELSFTVPAGGEFENEIFVSAVATLSEGDLAMVVLTALEDQEETVSF